MLNGLEEQEEEEQLLPVLPVFLQRCPWLCELSFLDFPSPSFMLWWPEDNCTKTHETRNKGHGRLDVRSDQSDVTSCQSHGYFQESNSSTHLTNTHCSTHLFYTAARHRGAQAVRGLLVPLLLSDLVLVALKIVQKSVTLRVNRTQRALSYRDKSNRFSFPQISTDFAAAEVCAV